MNSSAMEAKVMNSVVHKGVKSAGWEKRITHLPLKSSGKWMGPWVVTASKLGAVSPISGILLYVCCSIKHSSLSKWFAVANCMDVL